MSTTHSTRIAFTLFAIIFASPLAATQPTLKEIMQGLRDNFVTLTDGLLLEEPEQVLLAAKNIAGHAPISKAQRNIIATSLGPRIKNFAQFDQRVHNAAVAISEASLNTDRALIQQEYQKMIDSCIACHTAYKADVSQALSDFINEP